MPNLTWGDLRDMATGTVLVFVQPHDIYPYCIVPAGTLAIVADNCLATSFPTLDVLPGDPAVCKTLTEWDGCVSFAPINDGYSWTDMSPLALMKNDDV